MNNKNNVITYEEELACVSERFNMTKEETLRVIIHDMYIGEVTLSEFKDAIVLIWDNNHDECVEYDINGNVIVDDDLEDPPF